MANTNLTGFVKSFLGFYGSGGDAVLTPLILAAKQTLENSGVKEPTEKFELYNLAVALHVKIVTDGDPKGDLQRALSNIVLQIKDYGGGETA